MYLEDFYAGVFSLEFQLGTFSEDNSIKEYLFEYFYLGISLQAF